MPGEERVGHGRVASPAKEAYVGPESHISRPVNGRIGLFGMTYKAYGLAVDISHTAVRLQHLMGIDPVISSLRMAFETDFSSVGVRPSSQKSQGTFAIRTAVYFVTSKTLDLAIEERKRDYGRIRR